MNSDQDRQIGPDLDPNCLIPDSFPERILKKNFFEKSAADSKSMENYPAFQIFTSFFLFF